MAGERCRLRPHTLHQTAVAAHRVDRVVEEVEAGLVVAARKPALADRHPDTGRDALTERPRRGLDARHPVILRMAWRLAAQLAEALDVVERHRGLAQALVLGVDGPRAREIEHRPQQHRRMPVRKHETVAVGPDRVLRVETHDPVPECVHKRRQRHRRPGMPGIRRLHRVDRQRADRVDGERVGVLRRCHDRLRHCCCRCAPATAASARMTARSLCTRPAGMLRSPARSRASIAVFSLPVTSQSMRRARFSIG